MYMVEPVLVLWLLNLFSDTSVLNLLGFFCKLLCALLGLVVEVSLTLALSRSSTLDFNKLLRICMVS